MEKILPDPLPEIVFGSKESTISRAISKAVKAEQLKKLASRIYTSNLHDTEEEIVARNRYLILGKLFPGAVLSHRTALEGGTPTNGCIFITYKYTKNVLLPGLLVRLFKGAGPAVGDTPFVNNLYLASRPRAFLENMQLSRKRDKVAKTLSSKEIEQRLEKLCRIHGPAEFNQLRDQAKVLSKQLHMEKEFKALNKLIGAILGTKETRILRTDAARARAIGKPYDTARRIIC